MRRIEVEGTVESIVAKNNGWGADKQFVGVSVKSTSIDEEKISWSTTIDIPMDMIPEELKVGATVKTLIGISETPVEDENVEEDETGDIADDVPDPREAE